MSFRVVIEAEAEREFAEAVAFYEEREPGLGQRFAHEVYDAFRKVSKDLERFPLASRLTRKAKISPPWPYAIYFAVKSATQEVVISTVWHGARNPAELRRRLK
jgi:plasmid stabilization system protein ParE